MYVINISIFQTNHFIFTRQTFLQPCGCILFPFFQPFDT